MVIHITRYSPDSCSCSLDFSWDDAVEPRVHSLSAIVKKCDAHKILTDQQIFDTVFNENRLKNQTLGAFVSNVDSIGETYEDDSKTLQRRLKDTINYNYTFTGTAPDRKLEVEFKDRITDQVITIKSTEITAVENELLTKYDRSKDEIVIKGKEVAVEPK